MQLVRWSYMNIHMPMLKDGNGDLFCTSHQLSDALHISEDSLRTMRSNHKDEFDSLSVSNAHAKEILQQNRVEFGVQRVRKDMALWSVDDMLLVAFWTRCPTAKFFRKELIQFIKKNATVSVVNTELHAMRAELDGIKEVVKALTSQAPQLTPAEPTVYLRLVK